MNPLGPIDTIVATRDVIPFWIREGFQRRMMPWKSIGRVFAMKSQTSRMWNILEKIMNTARMRKEALCSKWTQQSIRLILELRGLGPRANAVADVARVEAILEGLLVVRLEVLLLVMTLTVFSVEVWI
jgi:hypothetical protein